MVDKDKLVSKPGFKRGELNMEIDTLSERSEEEEEEAGRKSKPQRSRRPSGRKRSMSRYKVCIIKKDLRKKITLPKKYFMEESIKIIRQQSELSILVIPIMNVLYIQHNANQTPYSGHVHSLNINYRFRSQPGKIYWIKLMTACT